MERVELHIAAGGRQEVWRHRAEALDCEVNFAIYLPPQADTAPVPVIYFLSGLTCNEQNFITKAGAQAFAAQHGVAIVAPETSPRGDGVADDPAYDMGQGAGFYLNATEAPWAAHFQMYDYIRAELPALIEATFPVTDARSIMGHSMGGHGALVIGLRNPGRYKAISAFSPIVAPTQVPWGEKAFTGYLGADRSTWAAYDATALLAHAAERLPILIDQGSADNFLETQLKPEIFVAEAQRLGHPVELRMQQGYDHSYYFISSFIGDHIAHHAAALKGA
ncbi:S-formylglutathione hydrolase [Ketogulonicigenium vulgare]|uniref:S-formylglutathione hydrolase n=1 Tax=Ketogulonicigenium vulgare TaxID=92945 RepID=UPI002359CFF3|nr:S-formylglutathione hydrolase [Ketogulonicigenium vulgare]